MTVGWGDGTEIATNTNLLARAPIGAGSAHAFMVGRATSGISVWGNQARFERALTVDTARGRGAQCFAFAV